MWRRLPSIFLKCVCVCLSIGDFDSLTWYKWAPVISAQTFRVLHSFSAPPDGEQPYAGLTIIGRNLFGTTEYGGTRGCGVVFKIDPFGVESILHSFTCSPDGEYPFATLISVDGNLYGTTALGGKFSYGSVFKIDSQGLETVLHSFKSRGKDGQSPYAGLARNSAGNFYVTTVEGGAFNAGVILEFGPTIGGEKILHNFENGLDGANPISVLTLDSFGNLYGTAQRGGSTLCGFGCGTVFKVDIDGNFSVLHSFTGTPDGYDPAYEKLTIDFAGNLFGTTASGGAFNAGTIFKLDPQGNETILYNFTGGADGAGPMAGVVMDSAGNLYGTTFSGGSANAGTVFKLDTSGEETILHSFTGIKDGENPYAGIVMDKVGNLYGATPTGGAGGQGTVFKIIP